MNSEIIDASLEHVAERCEDPTPLVYQRLFEQHPEFRELFILDRQDEAKGHMLSEVITCISDFVGPRHISEGLITTEMINHDHLGIPNDVFQTFFTIVRDTFKDILGNEWSEDYESNWNELLTALSQMVKEKAA